MRAHHDPTLFPYTTLFRSRRRHDDVTGVTQLAGKGLHFAVVEAAANLVEKDVHEQDSGYWANSSANDIWKPDKTPSPCTMSSSRDRKSTRLNSSHVKISYA